LKEIEKVLEFIIEIEKIKNVLRKTKPIGLIVMKTQLSIESF